MAKKSAKPKELDITISEVEGRELLISIDGRLGDLDKLFKTCITSGLQDAAEDVAKRVKILREMRMSINEGLGDNPEPKAGEEDDQTKEDDQ